jgi:hypothetical protein
MHLKPIQLTVTRQLVSYQPLNLETEALVEGQPHQTEEQEAGTAR